MTADPSVDWTLFGRPIRFKLNSEVRKSPLLVRLDLAPTKDDSSEAGTSSSSGAAASVAAPVAVAVAAAPAAKPLPLQHAVQGLAVTDCRSCSSPNFVGFRFCQNCGIPSFNQ